MAKDIEYGILLRVKDLGSRNIKRLNRSLGKLGRTARGVGAGGFGLFDGRGPGGPGGFLAGAFEGVGKLAAAPLKMLSGLSGLVPQVGGIFSGVFGAAAGALEGIATVAGNVAGAVVNAFAAAGSAIIDTISGLVRAVGSMVSEVGRLLVGLAGRATAIFAKVGVAGAAAFGGITAAALRSASAFEEGMAEVATIATRITGPTFRRVKQEVSTLAAEFGKSAREMAGGLYQSISAGVTRAGDALHVLRVGSMAAITGLTNMETAVKAVTRSLNAYQLSARYAMGVSDKFFTGVRLGVFRFAELEHAVGSVVGTAAQLGVSLNEVIASFTALTKGGLGIDRAATAVRSLMAQVLKPTKEATKWAERLGLAFGYKALKGKGLARFLADLRKATRGSPELLAKLFPNRRALTGLLPLMGRQFGMFVSDLDEIRRGSGATERAFERMADTFSFKWRQAWESIKATGRAYAEPLMGPLKQVFTAIRRGAEAATPVARALGEALAGRLQSALSWLANTDFTPALRALYKGMQSIHAGALVTGRALHDAFDWLGDRDWSLEGLKRALRAVKDVAALIPRLFVMGEGEGVRPGLITHALIGAFEYVLSWLRGELEILWVETGRKLSLNLLEAISNALGAVREGLFAAQDEPVIALYNRTRDTYKPGNRPPDWDVLPEDQQETMRREYYMGHPFKKLAHAKALGLIGTLQGAADRGRIDIARGIGGRAEEQEREAIRRRQRGGMDRGARRMGLATERLGEVGGRMGEHIIGATEDPQAAARAELHSAIQAYADSHKALMEELMRDNELTRDEVERLRAFEQENAREIRMLRRRVEATR